MGLLGFVNLRRINAMNTKHNNSHGQGLITNLFQLCCSGREETICPILYCIQFASQNAWIARCQEICMCKDTCQESWNSQGLRTLVLTQTVAEFFVRTCDPNPETNKLPLQLLKNISWPEKDPIIPQGDPMSFNTATCCDAVAPTEESLFYQHKASHCQKKWCSWNKSSFKASSSFLPRA